MIVNILKYINSQRVTEFWVNDVPKPRDSDSKRRGHETRHMHRNQEYIRTTSPIRMHIRIENKSRIQIVRDCLRNSLKVNVYRILRRKSSLI
jgi:hypothetical protein